MLPESPGDEWYSYAVVRVVPRVEREEFVNAGVVLFVPARRLLHTRIELDRERLRALDPEIDLDEVERHLRSVTSICNGSPDGGPIAELPAAERFHWLTAPRSTMIQVSPVHEGHTNDPAATLDRLFKLYVETN